MRVDPDRLIELYASLGEARAEAEVARAMDRIAAALAEVQALADGGRIADLGTPTVRLAAAARRIGMTTLARVASDVCLAAHAGGGPALGATLARLTRIGDRSLSEIVGLCGTGD